MNGGAMDFHVRGVVAWLLVLSSGIIGVVALAVAAIVVRGTGVDVFGYIAAFVTGAVLTLGQYLLATAVRRRAGER